MSNPANPEDEIIDESEHFFAKPALGHFVFGYTLIVTKDHFPSFAYVPDHLFPELDAFRKTVLRKLHSISGHPITTMEHGALDRCQRGGSCIDHAHLHLMPLPADLFPALSARFSFAELGSISELRRFQEAQVPYLFYQRELLRGYGVGLSEDVPSQMLRRIACQSLGTPELWDWRNAPMRDAVQRFASEYKNLPVGASGNGGSLSSLSACAGKTIADA